MRGKGRRKKEEGRKKQGEWRIRRGKGKAQLALAGAKALKICGGRRSGRLAGHALLGAVLPIINELVSTEEQRGADGRLIEPGGVEDVRNGRSRTRLISPGKINLSESTIGQGDVDLYKKQEAGEWAALAKTGLGLLRLGDGAPNDALILRQLPPPFGDRAESPTDSDLGRGAGIKRNKGRITVLAIPVGLPDSAPPFP
jgi:hypothetical protein